MDGPWVYGRLLSNVTSLDGGVNSLTFQPFVNYNMPRGWYLVSTPFGKQPVKSNSRRFTTSSTRPSGRRG